MTRELRDVLGAAEAATERGLPAFDHVVMARGVTRRAKRRTATRQAVTGLVAGVSLGVVGFGGYFAYDKLSDEVNPVVIPSPTDGPQPTPTGDWPDVADRAVTTGVGLPDAVALTGEAYATADTGWVLAIFDSTKYNGIEEPTQGERVLYLVSPTGEQYEVANLTRYGSPHLAAWDIERQVALIVEGRYVALTIDLASGEVTHEWQFCGEGGSMTAKDLPGDEWLLRGFCSGEALDGVYADDFTFVTDEGIVKGGEGITVMDIGDIQVRYEFEMPPAQSFRAYHSDGTEIALQPVGDEVQCFPQGPSRMGGLAVTCYGLDDMRESGMSLWPDRGEIWNLDLNGGVPTQIAGLDYYATIEDLLGWPEDSEGISLNGYTLAGDNDVVAYSGVFQAVLDEGGPILMTNGERLASTCYGGVGGTVLLTGDGELWTWDSRTGETITLIPVTEPGGDAVWVGASEGGAIIHP